MSPKTTMTGFRNIVNSTPKSRFAKIQQTANAAISAFTKTIETLTHANVQLDLESEIATKEMEALKAFNDQVLAQKETNTKVISKIKAIIE